jgi:hypothetical protein
VLDELDIHLDHINNWADLVNDLHMHDIQNDRQRNLLYIVSHPVQCTSNIHERPYLIHIL